jgi:CheY-like chemotaxis protein
LTLPFTVIRKTAINQSVLNQSTTVWDGPPLRILFVEDEPINIAFGTALLDQLGFDFIVASNGKECLRALGMGRFDLVLLDILMPIMSGEEALCEIRNKEQGTTCHQPVIALTAHSMHGDKERFLEVGFDGYVSKPMTTEDLVVEIKRVMGMVAAAVTS